MDDRNDSVVYSRVRLLRIIGLLVKGGTNIYCYVHYIDYGFGNWVKAVSYFDLFVYNSEFQESLAVMPKQMYTKPWQAVSVALMGVSPVRNFDFEKVIYLVT
jgi:hypothetical protein